MDPKLNKRNTLKYVFLAGGGKVHHSFTSKESNSLIALLLTSESCSLLCKCSQ